MSQLIDNLNTIESVKTDIKSAIENKGVDMTGVSFPGYASKIGEITTSFVTVPLNVSVNGTYTPGEGVDGYSQVVVDVPISGWDQKSITEKSYEIINLDNSASFVASYAFTYSNIKTVNLPYATTVGDYAFQSCSLLTQVSLPMCSSIGNFAFQLCNSLTQVSLPMCSYIGSYAFKDCSLLTQVSLPMCSSIGANTFYSCSLLTQVSLPMCSSIGINAFRSCSLLSIITIGYSGVCNLNNSNAFSTTPIASGTGSIYVPSSLVDAYKSASNWSYFSTQIFPIE